MKTPAAAASKPGYRSFELPERVVLPPRRMGDLLKTVVVEFFLQVDRDGLNPLIQDGSLPFVFRVGDPSAYRRDLRVLSACLYERLGLSTGLPKPTRAMTLDEAVNLIWPYNRDPRGVELQRLFGCSPDGIRKIVQRGGLKISRVARARNGPHASNNYSRASLIAFLKANRVN